MPKNSVMKWNCEQITNMIEKNKFNFENIIQRSYVWENERKSELIHSIIENYPVPPLYAMRVDGKTYDFLDGKQRLEAIHGFMKDEYHLIGIDPVLLYDEDECDGDNELVDVNGLTYSQLPETVRKRINSYALNTYYFDGITTEQTRIMFKKLNNGKPLSTKERNIANCIDILNISEIGKHEFFKKGITEKSLKARKQIPMIMKIWLMLNEDLEDISFASKDFNDIMMETKISDEEKAQINKVLDLMLEVLNLLDEGKAKAARRKFLSETNLVSLVPIFNDVINSGDSAKDLAMFITEIFTTKKTVSPKYADACSAGSAKNSSIQVRNKELVKAWNAFLKSKEKAEEESENLVENNSEAPEAPAEDKVVNFPTGSTKGDDEAQNEYRYGMRLRGFSPMCQPDEGLVRREDDVSGNYHDIIVYNRELSSEELDQYELDSLN